MAPGCGDAGAARHLTPLLALFDLDGTLFLSHDPLSGRALVETLGQTYDVEVDPDAPANVDHRGLTAKRIGRNVLRDAGLPGGGDRRAPGSLACSLRATSSFCPTLTRPAGRLAQAQRQGSPGCKRVAFGSRS
jgi:hypothetical protein